MATFIPTRVSKQKKTIGCNGSPCNVISAMIVVGHRMFEKNNIGNKQKKKKDDNTG